MNILLLIPARTGSKGIPDKNFRPLLNNPLWGYSLQQAVIVEQYINSLGIDKAYVAISTDDTSRFPEEASNYLIDRPNKYATDDSPVIDTIKDAIEQFEAIRNIHVDAVVLLQPTSPLRLPEDIARCIALLMQRECKHPVVSGYLMRVKEKGKTDSKRNHAHFQRDGSIFAIPRSLIDKGLILDGEEYEVEFPKSRGVDIDTEDDWYMAEALLLRRLYVQEDSSKA